RSIGVEFDVGHARDRGHYRTRAEHGKGLVGRWDEVRSGYQDCPGNRKPSLKKHMLEKVHEDIVVVAGAVCNGCSSRRLFWRNSRFARSRSTSAKIALTRSLSHITSQTLIICESFRNCIENSAQPILKQARYSE